VLAGHVLGSLLLTLVSLAVLIAVAVLVGFNSPAGAPRWLAALGLLVLLAIAPTWLSVALGLFAKSVETASNMPMFLVPFLGSGFVPVDSMPAGLRWFAQNQPFTPITNAVRRLLSNQPVGSAGATAIVWCVAITAGSYLWAKHLYDRQPAT
jgi:ABC-2 type transport system permease protein